jgi:hypothetical protein
MLQRWCQHAVKANEIGQVRGAVPPRPRPPSASAQACILHAHLLLLCYHLPEQELNRSLVTTLISSQVTQRAPAGAD